MAVVGSVVARLVADATPLDRGLRVAGAKIERLERDTRSHLRAVDKSFATATVGAGRLGAQMAALGRTITSGFGGLVGIASGVGLVGVAHAVRNVVDSAADLGAAAKTANVTSEALQELGFAARAARIDSDKLVDGLKELSLRGDEFVTTAGGPAAEAFKRLGYTSKTLADGLKEPDRLFEQIIGRLGELDRAAQIRVADEVFGGGAGEQFVRFVDQGEAGIRAMRDRARELGATLSNEAVAGAQQVAAEFDLLMSRVNAWWQSTVLDIVAFVRDGRNFDLTGQRGSPLKIDNRDQPIRTPDGGVIFRQNPVGRGANSLDLEELFGVKLTAGQGIPRAAPRFDFVGGGATFDELLSSFGLEKPKGGRSTGAIREQRDAVEGVIRALQEELRLVGANSTEQRIAAELRRAGVDASSAQGQAITSLVRTIESENDALARLQEQLQEAEGLARGFASSLINDLSNGVSAAEALSNAFADLGRQLLQMAANKAITALFGNLFGSVFGAPAIGGAGNFSIGGVPLYAAGTPWHPGGAAIVGEHGPELVTLPRGASVLNASRTAELIRPTMPAGFNFSAPANDFGPAAPIVVNISTTVDARGSNLSEGQIKAMLDQRDRALKKALPGALADARRRGAA